MTKKILLALALVLGTVSFAPPASACGGYGNLDPEVAAVRDAVLRYADTRVSPHTRNWAHSVLVTGDRATAVVRIGSAVERDVRLVRRGDGWRVTRMGPRRSVG